MGQSLFGTGKGREPSPKSLTIDQKIRDDYKESSRIIKLLLLGAGESGKSTLWKQTIALYGQGFDDKSRTDFRENIYQNIMSGMKMLVEKSDEFGGPCATSPSVRDSKDYYINLDVKSKLISEVFTAEDADHTITLWADPGIKLTYDRRASFQLPDTTAYFFDHTARIVAPDYVPTFEDVLKCRSRTTGVIETCFNIGADRFKIIDVGGQRSERKKWINCFEDVTAVIFVAAISEYDQSLYEDQEVNRLTEAIALFHQTCNSGWFTDPAVILFLNKRDLFQEKIQRVPLNTLFPEYTGGSDYKSAADFIQQKFEEVDQSGTTIYCHLTCATDQNNIDFTFNAIKKIIINKSLAKTGLL